MEVKNVEGDVADVEIGGVRKQIRLDLISDRPQVGEFVIIHAGFAIRTLSRDEAMETIKIFQDGWNLELI
jgi:hydrogenase expression/formation protein HypC